MTARRRSLPGGPSPARSGRDPAPATATCTRGAAHPPLSWGLQPPAAAEPSASEEACPSSLAVLRGPAEGRARGRHGRDHVPEAQVAAGRGRRYGRPGVPQPFPGLRGRRREAGRRTAMFSHPSLPRGARPPFPQRWEGESVIDC